MSEQQRPPSWDDQERIRRWIAGAQQRETQMIPVSEELFQAAALQAGEVVLDVGVGTGPTSVRAARAVGPMGRVVASDIAPAMIDVARESADVDGIEWLVADAETYDFGASSFDAVLSRFGVMFFPDPVAAFGNLAEATRSGGRFAASVWRTRDHVPLFDLPYATAARVLDQLGLAYEPVAVDESQCSLGTAEKIESVLVPAGWHELEVRPTGRSLYVGGEMSAETAAESAVDVGPARALLEGQPPGVRERVRAALTVEFRSRHDGTGVLVDGGFLIVTARR